MKIAKRNNICKMVTKARYIYCTLLIAISITSILAMNLFAIKFVQINGSTLVVTSNSNYAISSPALSAKNWRCLSVNGDNILIVTLTNEKMDKSFSRLSIGDQNLIINLRDDLSTGNNGYAHVSSGSRGFNYAMSSDTNSYSSSTSVSSFSGIEAQNEQSIDMRDENNFSVSRSDLPLNWSRVFFIGDLIAMVYRSGEVKMLPISLLDAEESAAVNRLKTEAREMQRRNAQQISSTMQHSLDMVTNVFNNVMSRLPRPPDYHNAVGNMFGDNFPFGPNNGPFSVSSGWPFNGNGAFAFAGGP